jgi:hypothetical protein
MHRGEHPPLHSFMSRDEHFVSGGKPFDCTGFDVVEREGVPIGTNLQARFATKVPGCAVPVEIALHAISDHRVVHSKGFSGLHATTPSAGGLTVL